MHYKKEISKLITEALKDYFSPEGVLTRGVGVTREGAVITTADALPNDVMVIAQKGTTDLDLFRARASEIDAEQMTHIVSAWL